MQIGLTNEYRAKLWREVGANGPVEENKIYWDYKSRRSELLEEFLKIDYSTEESIMRFLIMYGFPEPLLDETGVNTPAMRELTEFIKRVIAVLNRANKKVYTQNLSQIKKENQTDDDRTIFLDIMNLLTGSCILECLEMPEDTNYEMDTPILFFLMELLMRWRRCGNNEERIMQEFKELFVRVFCEDGIKNVGKESMWIQFSKLIDWGDMSLYKIVRDREGFMNFGIRRDVKLNFSTTLSGKSWREKENTRELIGEFWKDFSKHIMEEYCTFFWDSVNWRVKFRKNGEMELVPDGANMVQALMLALAYTYDSKTYLRVCENCKQFFYPAATHPHSICCSSRCADRRRKRIDRQRKKMR